MVMIAAGTREFLGGLDGVSLREGEEVTIDDARPGVIAAPADADALARLLRAAHAHGLQLVARSGGTQLHIGNAPTGVDVVLDLSSLSGVTEYRPRDLTITVAAGTPVAEVQRVLAAEGQMLGLDPPLPEQASVGGTLAANACGPRRYRYGTARDFVIGISALLADGAAIKSGGRVVKNVAGYDFAKLLIGSWGTLAIITGSTFRVYPLPAASGAVVAGFTGLAEAQGAAMAIAGSTLAPLSLDLTSPAALAADVPGGGGWLLVSEAGGSPAALRRTRDELIHLCRGHGATAVAFLENQDANELLAGVRDFGHGPEAAILTLRVSTRPARAGEVWQVLARAADARGLAPTGVIRAGNGVLLMTLAGTSADEPGLVRDLRATLQPMGATMMVERCRPETKAAIDVWGIGGDDLTIMRRVKEQYDPTAILSPGRGPAGA